MPIQRHEALASLSRQHHEGLILAQLIKKGAPDYKGLPTDTEGKRKHVVKKFEKELAPHFYIEEEILFDFVKQQKSLPEEIQSMIHEIMEEHKKIGQLVEEIETTDNPIAPMDDLGHLLESHIRKEERQLFQMIQEFLGEPNMQELKAKIEDF